MTEHWQETTLGEMVHLQRSRVDPSTSEQGEIWTHWSIPALDETGGPINEPVSAIGSHKFRLAADCVLVSLLNPRIPRFAVAEAGPQVVCSTEFAALAPLGVLSLEFLACLVSAPTFQHSLQGLAQGTTKSRERVKPAELLNMRFRVPPEAEQRRIVDLIGSIDTCIDSLEGQIDVTRTAREGVLSELLSNPGDDWKSVTLGHVATVRSGYAFKSTDFAEVGLPVVKIANVRDGVVDLAGCSFLPDEIASSRPESLLHRGDLLITMTGDVGAVGRVAVESAVLNQRVGKVATHDSDTDVGFLFAFLRCAQTRRVVQQLAAGNAQPNVSPKALHSLPLPLPPLSAQHQISDLINALDRQIEAIQSQLTAVRYMRTGILSKLLSEESILDDSYDMAVGL